MLAEDTVALYLASRPALAGMLDPTTLRVAEIGDGNLNLVFICTDGTGRGLVLKQALPYVRLVGPDWPMTEARADREAAAIRVHSALSDDVCRLLDFDPQAHVLALEDLSDHEVFRTRLNAGGDYHGVAERVAEFVADVAFGTSFLALGEGGFRVRAAAAANPDMCAITEDLVVTEPYLGAPRNSVRPGVHGDVDVLQADSEWVAAAMALKHRFLTVQEALLHGDLHTGSVFVRGTGADLSVKTFDSEFACYGPIGFDLGLMWANMLAAAARAAALGDRGRAAGLVSTLASGWEAFVARFDVHWRERQAPEKYPPEYRRCWLDRIRSDAFGFAGCEAARRIIGLAKVSDVETLDDAGYTVAARLMLRWSRDLLVRRDDVTVDDLAAALPAPGIGAQR